MQRTMPALLLLAALAACEEEVLPPRVGDAAPTFQLIADDGTEVSLSDHRGQWVVLYFYPKDFSTGCTIQARNFQRDIHKYGARNAVILGVGMDDPDSHARFCSAQGLSFRLLSDTEGVVSTAYGSIKGAGNSRFSERNTFVIDPEGTIQRVYLGVNPSTHSDAVLGDLARFQGVEPGRQGNFSVDRLMPGG
jgi:peroxiredoxin Q/BCP